MELNELLSFPSGEVSFEDVKEERDEVKNSFYKQAKELMLNYRIKKVSGSETRYYFINEIELYYYRAGHEDPYVHPHFYKGKQFRVHYSGVDITFGSYWDKESEAKEHFKEQGYSDHNRTLEFWQVEDFVTNGTYYGGILIREIQEEKMQPINGPLRVLCELFYMEGESIEVKEDSVQLHLEKCESRSGKISAHWRKGLNSNEKEENTDREEYRTHFKRYKLNG
jgi:hypothetical protein